MLLLIVMALWWFLLRPAQSDADWVSVTEPFAICGEAGPRAAGCVVDGDTVVLGFGREQRRIRLTGFDAPEIDGACTAERRRAAEARRALHRWLAQGPFEWSGGVQPPRDRYGRELRAARRDGGSPGDTDLLAHSMIAQGLAVADGRGEPEPQWCG
ncbi:hypothetical protein MACH05_06170 [Qipengyuania nanhaisediminis]